MNGVDWTWQRAAGPVSKERFAFIGVRSCDIHAIAIEDRIFLKGAHVDPHYQARRSDAFIVAINCGTAGGACFCVSMRTGPKAECGRRLCTMVTGRAITVHP
ncbi:MAG TPA: hypothetical protein VE175_15950 [Woeseiaceae bacterium]|nr:hypothetical protein [Woeseiaceae bacterium]